MSYPTHHESLSLLHDALTLCRESQRRAIAFQDAGMAERFDMQAIALAEAIKVLSGTKGPSDFLALFRPETYGLKDVESAPIEAADLDPATLAKVLRKRPTKKPDDEEWRTATFTVTTGQRAVIQQALAGIKKEGELPPSAPDGLALYGLALDYVTNHPQ